MKVERCKASGLLRLVGLALAAVLISAPTARAEWIRADDDVMGTRARVELWHEDPAAGRAAVAAVLAELHRIDALMSPYKPDSALSRINREAAAEPVAVGAELRGLIERSQEFSRLTGGAFDITYASAGHLYDYRESRRPDQATLEQALTAIDYRHVVVDDAAGTVAFGRQGVRIDLGGIAKGHAVDRCIALLADRGVRHALVSAGGDTRVIGQRWGKPWNVAIQHPRRDERVVAMLPLQDEAVSTSGDYERYFVEDGVRYHHILDPATGRSVDQVRSVTIIGDDATTTDALSTSVFVLGVVDGLALVNRMPGIEAFIVDGEGLGHYSQGLAAGRPASPPTP